MTKLKKYWIFTLIGTLAVSFYPLYMGVSVVFDMITEGTVIEENFPKYVIPYTPIALSVIGAVILMPVLFKYAEKYIVLTASVISLGVFFLSELLLESKVIVTTTVTTTLESWQMFMCYLPIEEHGTKTAVEILIGEYSPVFKLHFYLISVVLIISILNCIYGFAKLLYINNFIRLKSLIVQSACTVLFLGLCILACFTAFFRDGEITVSVISAILMCLFFITFGVTAGIYTGSFLVGKKKKLSMLFPSAVSLTVTLLMYIGEMFLLSGHLYRFGSGLLFDAVPGIVLAPVDVLVIILSGGISAVICYLLNKGTA